MEACDVGSLPLIADEALIRRGAQDVLSPGRSSSGPATEFRRVIIRALMDKMRAGMDVPTYPQFRDMNEMFLTMLKGLEVLEGRYVEIGRLEVKDPRIPEVLVAREHARQVAESLGLEAVRLRVCITGPHTLSFSFAFRSPGLFERLGHVLSEVVKANVVSDKHFRVELLVLDEPTFGTVDDLLVEPGSEGREALLKAWEEALRTARSLGARTGIHLHSTADGLFWEVEALEVIESHVDDPFYKLEETRRLLEEKDKFVRASICKTDFDELISARIRSERPGLSEHELMEEVGEAWKAIRSGRLDPTAFLEPVEVMADRLRAIVESLGPDRILFVGPECGLRGFPTYGTAMECLRRVREACDMV
ncbi:hypothetical protein B6U66_03105 [Candidatus Bathyarchaeota archaeon ex4484_135]|nr:MAG: hypothetical protein B6U66_03105 [Candidatus Bathyarchaeota archaeon ex4484_135]